MSTPGGILSTIEIYICIHYILRDISIYIFAILIIYYYKTGDRRHGAEKRGDKAPQLGPDGEPRVPRKREFDRRSSTGRTGEQRKDSRGPHSFGNVKQEAADAEKDPASAEPELDTDAPGEAAAEDATPVPELPKVVTYDEFLKKRNEAAANSANKSVVLETKSIRTVTADDFAGLKTKEEEETVFLQLGKLKVSKPVTKAAPAKNTPALQLAFKVQSEEPAADSYERPARGGDRSSRAPAGRTGGASPRTSTGPKSSVNVNDSEAFPSL